MILMPQLLYCLHNAPVVVPLKIFRIVICKDRPPRIKFEYLQRPKDDGGLALPNPWLYYLAAQLQHLIGIFRTDMEPASSSQVIILYTIGRGPIPTALEALDSAKP